MVEEQEETLEEWWFKQWVSNHDLNVVSFEELIDWILTKAVTMLS